MLALQKPSGGRAKQGAQPEGRSSRGSQGKTASRPGSDAKGKSSGQPANPGKRRPGKGKRPAADSQVRAQAASATSRPFHNALRAVASIFGGGASQRDN